MHEASLAKNILDIIKEYSGQIDGKKVKKVTLRVGELSGVYPDALLLYFSEFSKGTTAEGAELEFQRLSVQGNCRECQQTFEIRNYEFNCPNCNGIKFDVVGGDEFELINLEVE
jgi:hydrogenase nickel incorporation protein HypA/HybF